MRKLTIPVIFLLFSTAVLAEFDYKSYQASTFAEIKFTHRDDLLKASKRSDFVISAATFKYSIPVTFIKELRKISGFNKSIIKAWQKSLRIPDEFVDLYQHEFKVQFGAETYWIPVQEALLLPMSSELHPGDKFELYIVLIGAKNNKLVMLATEFKSDRAPL